MVQPCSLQEVTSSLNCISHPPPFPQAAITDFTMTTAHIHVAKRRDQFVLNYSPHDWAASMDWLVEAAASSERGAVVPIEGFIFGDHFSSL